MRRAVAVVAVAVTTAACSACSAGSKPSSIPLAPLPSSSSLSPVTTAEPGEADQAVITVDARHELGPISPYVRGLSGGVDAEALRDMGITVNSWGGNPATRFNYEIGHAWNAGADWEYRNGNYDQTGDAARDFVAESRAGGAAVRLAVPTIGWVAKDDDTDTCSFPTASGCDGGAGLDCEHPGTVADPARANVESTPEMVQAWIARLTEAEGAAPGFIAMDNEPELWGHTHYDVHPACTTYEEVLDTYLTYAEAVQHVAPRARLMGPVSCCWFDYWGTAPRDDDYLGWFLSEVRRHDARTGTRSLHLLDVHYYPQSDVYNEDADEATAARRLRSTRSLWDPSYVDESWVDEPIAFIPRMRETIAAAYPGTGLAISEWNFGADATMNGALAIADVLAILGREGVEMASYWRHPPLASPGYFAFKIHGNYDGRGSSFDGVALATTSPDVDRIGAYSAVDPEARTLRVLLINKLPDEDVDTPVAIDGATVGRRATIYRYSSANPDEIVSEELVAGRTSFSVLLPASSITLVELDLAA